MSTMTVNWDLISPEEFEELCYHILSTLGSVNLEWHGEKGSDRGRDITCQKTVPILPGKEEVTSWVVQCKRYTKRKLTRQDLDDSISWAKAHKPTHYLLITTAVLISSTRDWLDSVKKDLQFKIYLIERPGLEELVRENIDKLHPYLPEQLYRELSIGRHVSHAKSTTFEDLFGLRTVSAAATLKEQIFQKTVIPQNTAWPKQVYGQSVIIERGCNINSHIYARREIIINRGTIVKGAVVCPGNVDITDCELTDICGSQITMHGSCLVHGKFITDRDTFVPPSSRISSIFCGGSRLEIGEKSVVENVICKDTVVLGENVNIAGVLRCSDLSLGHGCIISWVSATGNVKIPENSSIANLATKGSVHIETGAQVTRLHTLSNVELCSGCTLQEISCRNLLAQNDVKIEKLRATGSVTIRGEGAGFQGGYIIANGDVTLPNDSNVEVIYSKGEVKLGHRCNVKFLAASNFQALDNFKCENIRCSGSVELGENCVVGSLQAVEDIKFKAGLRSEDWTVFSQKGNIAGQGLVKLKDTKVAADAVIRFAGGSLLTALIDRDQLELIDGLAGKGGRRS
ncbi:restriction endonuclease [Candidatus Bathyarchaeota archaeon]|nr:restriction endonuclease [Candidatus Bathyarchaeota archaeon]